MALRVTITSRIFDPEPAAASFRLEALANALVDAGHEVTVLTVTPPRGVGTGDESRRYKVRRSPVIRDAQGYVRGYLPYLSFDLVLFFRLLFRARQDVYITEPPPTTGFFVRLASAICRAPYVYYGADIWSEAAEQTDTPKWMLRTVKTIERFALRGARKVLSVSDEVTRRLGAFGVSASVETIGNGVDTDAFLSGLNQRENSGHSATRSKEYVYAGTASEWHGARVFVEAMPILLESHPDAILRFIGGGSEMPALEALATELKISDSVVFEPTLPPAQLAPVLNQSIAAVASVKAQSSYEFAFPTKLYSAAACGAPLLYVGAGPTRSFVATMVEGAPLGHSTDADPAEVADAMRQFAETPVSDNRREQVSRWAQQHVSLKAVSSRAVGVIEQAATPRRGTL